MADIRVGYMLLAQGWALVEGRGLVGNQAARLDSCSQKAGLVWWVHWEEQEEEPRVRLEEAG